MKKGLLLALIQTALAAGVAAKFYYDRATLPRVWTRAVPIDPDLPIRGRYVRIFAAVEPAQPLSTDSMVVRLSVVDEKLVAAPADEGLRVTRARDGAWALGEALAYFIPEHVPDPSILKAGEELWVEVSVPAKGLPRPVGLGVKRDGVLRPLGSN